VWPEQRLIVELDGYAAHRTRRAFEADRAKARALTVAGWRVVRMTPRQLTDELAADLSALLTRRPDIAASP
jgi:very-short-patch-repair endonuclease